MTLKIAIATKNAMLDVVNTRINAGAGPGTIKLYSGTQPATADTALSGNTLLATLSLTDPAFDAATGGTIALDADPDLSATAVGTGTATFARAADSDGNTVFDGSVNTTAADFTIASTAITTGQTVTVTTGTISFS